ncbi:MAG TPA: alcohol dehydrogenase catalytic domain-containing protein [Anaerolineales bacterium]|nr:alcohol dehydrogenase catalytic domain-containing protein [Anaerolineales bacterium]
MYGAGDVRTLKVGDLVIAPFVWSDGTCVFCREGLHTSCLHGGRYGSDGVDGGQGEAVRVPQAEIVPEAISTFFDNVTIAGGPAPARAYIEELLPDALEGRIEPGRVFDRVGRLDDVPDGYGAMNERKALKVMIEF